MDKGGNPLGNPKTRKIIMSVSCRSIKEWEFSQCQGGIVLL